MWSIFLNVFSHYKYYWLFLLLYYCSINVARAIKMKPPSAYLRKEKPTERKKAKEEKVKEDKILKEKQEPVKKAAKEEKAKAAAPESVTVEEELPYFQCFFVDEDEAQFPFYAFSPLVF